MIRRIQAMCGPLTPRGRCRPGQPKLEGQHKSAIETGRNRLVFAGAIFMLAFIAIGLRLVDLALVKGDASRLSALRRNAPQAEQIRADIVDRNGAVLATSVTTFSIFADPKLVADVERTAVGLHRVFPDLDLAGLQKKLRQKRRFVWIRRHTAPAAYARILSLGLAGVGMRKEFRRIYPHGSLTAHIVGFTNIDGRGLAGIEQNYNGLLDLGRRLQLSLDVRAQAVMRQTLARTIETFRAIGGAGLILDIKTGELLALVSLPDYDPHRPAEAGKVERFNRNIRGVYEMGSTFKIFNTAMALEYGVVKLTDRYDVRRPIRISRFAIKDYHPFRGRLTVADIFVKSSNIGSAKIALDVGGARQKAFLKRLGLLRPVDIELPAEAAPLFPRRWRPINTMTISYGHGISVTPVHLAAAVAAIVNDGVAIRPTLFRRRPGASVPSRRVISPGTSHAVRELMRQVVEHGTAKLARVDGYALGGKTGTAEKPGRRGYRRSHLLSSFVGVFPIDAPRYVVLVSIDEPKGTKATGYHATGGWVAAPAVRDIVKRIGPLYGVTPRRGAPIAGTPLMLAETGRPRAGSRRGSKPRQ